MTFLVLALYLAVGAAGIWGAFHPTLRSRFVLLQPDAGDPMLNAYVLEHELQWMTRPGYVGTLWSPPFFYPARGVLAYSENLLGILPLYALLRCGFPPGLSYQLLAILLSVLNYAAMLLVLRRFGVGPALAALGAFFFAFGMFRVAQVGHLQLLPSFYAPLALLLLWRLLAAPSRSKLWLLLLVHFLELLSSFYLGWFLLLALGLLLGTVLLLDGGSRRRLAAFCRDAPRAGGGGLLAWGAACYLTLRPYFAVAAELGHRPWGDVLVFLPRLRSWWAAPPGSWYGPLLAAFPAGTPGVSEHYLFPGVVFLGLALLSAAHFAALPREERRHPVLPLACWAAALGLVALSLYLPGLSLPGGHLVMPATSLWWLVFEVVPGASAIRAVGRVSIMVYLLLAVAVCWGAEAAIGRLRLRPAARCLLLGLLLAAGVTEQYVPDQPSRSKTEFFDRVARVRGRMPAGCRAVYVTLPAGKWFIPSQLVAMWAGLEANVPVVNGYSGNFPRNYPSSGATATPEEIRRWAGNEPCRVSGE